MFNCLENQGMKRSKFTNLIGRRTGGLNRYLSVIVVSLLLGFPTGVWARDKTFDAYVAATIGRNLGQLTAQALQDMQRFAGLKAEFSLEIQKARSAYFQQYPDGRDLEEAQARFGQLLLAKDLWYLNNAVIEGTESPRYKLLTEIAGEIDGGLVPWSRPAFKRLVEAMREDLGVLREGDMVWLLPDKFIKALDDNRDKLAVYQLARDYGEYLRAGEPMPAYAEPAKYLVLMFQLYGDLSLEAAVAEYKALREALGEKTLHEAARQVASVRQDKNGRLKDIASLGMVLHTQAPADEKQMTGGKLADGRTVVRETKPLFVLRALCSRDNPRANAFFTIAHSSHWSYDRRGIYVPAWGHYQLIEQAVGRDALEAAAVRLYETPMNVADGGWGGTGRWAKDPIEAFKAALLAGDDMKSHIRYFIVTDMVATDPAAIDKAYREFITLQGEDKLLEAAAKLQAAEWQPNKIGHGNVNVMTALKRMLGSKEFDNPLYQAWSAYAAGTTVVYDFVTHDTVHRKVIAKVLQASNEFVDLEIVDYRLNKDGSWNAKAFGARQPRLTAVVGSDNVNTYPAVPVDDFQCHGRPEVVKQTRETIDVAGQSFNSTRSVLAVRGGIFYPGKGWERYNSEVWTADRVPGRVLRYTDERLPRTTIVLSYYKAIPSADGPAGSPGTEQVWPVVTDRPQAPSPSYAPGTRVRVQDRAFWYDGSVSGFDERLGMWEVLLDKARGVLVQERYFPHDVFADFVTRGAIRTLDSQSKSAPKNSLPPTPASTHPTSPAPSDPTRPRPARGQRIVR